MLPSGLIKEFVDLRLGEDEKSIFVSVFAYPNQDIIEVEMLRLF